MEVAKGEGGLACGLVLLIPTLNKEGEEECLIETPSTEVPSTEVQAQTTLKRSGEAQDK